MDAGFEQESLGGRVHFGATYFYNSITNLIDANATFTSYTNVGKARTSGVEAFASADVTDSLRVRLDYTFTDATDEDTHTKLLRRPRNKVSVSTGWTPYDPLLLSASLVYMGETADLDRGTSAGVTLPGFVLVNIAADHKLNDRMSLFGRIDNLFNKQYENQTALRARASASTSESASPTSKCQAGHTSRRLRLICIAIAVS